MQLCRECRYLYHSDSRVPCICCESKSLTIPTAENLVDIVNRLLNRGIDVASASCEVHDVYDDDTGKGHIGKTVQLQIELNHLYPSMIFTDPPLPPGWLTYEYHTVDNHKIGPKYTGLSHSQGFTPLNNEELEFTTNLTISNLELWLDNFDSDGVKSVLKLGGYATGQ